VAADSKDLHPVLKSKGINKTTVKNCTESVKIAVPFDRACFNADGSKTYTKAEILAGAASGGLWQSALNIGRYQYYGDHVSESDQPGVKNKDGYINSSPTYFAGDVKRANQALSSIGIDFAISNFTPEHQDFYVIGKYANKAKEVGNKEPKLDIALGDGSFEKFKIAVSEVANKEWASAPGGVQQLATMDQYYAKFKARLDVYKNDK
jgi:hypothetical protein